MPDYMTHGVRIEIDDEIEQCLERERSAEREVIDASNATRIVLDRKRGEIASINADDITSIVGVA